MKNEILKEAGVLGAIGKFFRPVRDVVKTTKTVYEPLRDASGNLVKDIKGNIEFDLNKPRMTVSEKDVTNPSLFQQIAFPAAATVGVGALVKELAVDPFMQAKAEEETLKKLKSSTPQLEDVDDKTVKDYFGVIQTFAPRAATNPLVSGALVNKMVQFEGVDSNLVKDLAQIQGDSKGGLFRKLLEGGVAASSASMSS